MRLKGGQKREGVLDSEKNTQEYAIDRGRGVCTYIGARSTPREGEALSWRKNNDLKGEKVCKRRLLKGKGEKAQASCGDYR